MPSLYRAFGVLMLALSMPMFVCAQGRSPAASSMPVEVHGQVRFAQGGMPADNVLIKLESFDGGGSIQQELTDRTGKFRFSGLSPAQYTVIAHALGFKEAQQHVDLQTSSSNYIIFQLIPDSSIGVPAPVHSKVINVNVPAEAQSEFDKAREVLQQKSGDDGREHIREAVGHLEKAVRIFPAFAEARLMLGTAYMDLQQWQQAEQALRQTLELDPKAANAFFALGELYFLQSKFEEAEDVLASGIALEDRSCEAHFTLARVYWKQSALIKEEAQSRSLLEKSYKEVNQSLRLNPKFAGAHVMKGNLLLRAGRVDDAISEFQTYLNLDPRGEYAAQVREVIRKQKTTSPSRSLP